MRILAIDYGKKRTGIAVTDPLKIIAQPLTTIETLNLEKFITDYLNKEQVEEIVVGFPKHLNDTEADIVPEIKEFVKNISDKFTKIKFTYWDERFTSKLAVQSMIQAGFKKKDRQKKENIDKIAAAIILQDYMNYLQNII